MLMFTLGKIAATPVFTKARLAVLSTEQQDGGTLMIVAKAKFIVSPTAVGVIVAVAPGTVIPLFCNSIVTFATEVAEPLALKVT